MKKLALFCSLILLSFLAVPLAEANHGTIGHWERDLDGATGSDCDKRPFQYDWAEIVLWDSLDASWRTSGVLQDAIAQYEDAVWPGTFCVKVVTKDNSQQTRQNCQMATGAVRICNGTWPNWDVYYGVFIVSPGFGHWEDDQMNLRLDDNEIGTSYTARLTFMCHELGHALGLDEGFNQVEPSCINDTANSSAPSQHDIDTLNTRYQHSHAYDDDNLHWIRNNDFENFGCKPFPGSGPTHRAEAVIWDSMTSDWDDEIAQVISAYAALDDRLCIVKYTKSDSAGTRANCAYQLGVVRICNHEYNLPHPAEYQVIGGASLHLDNLSQRVRFEDDQLETYEERIFFLCHELGHAMGLDAHNPNPESCLNTLDVTAQQPDSFDDTTLGTDMNHTH